MEDQMVRVVPHSERANWRTALIIVIAEEPRPWVKPQGILLLHEH